MNDLALIHDPYVNFVYYKRPIDDDIELFIWYLIENDFNGISESVTPHNVAKTLAARLSNDDAHLLWKRKFMQDILNITQVFFNITKAQQIQLILKVVSDDACRKFHTDAYDLRLLCTYQGSGTEWIEDRYVNQKKLVTGSNKDIIRDFSKVKQTEPFEVAILKGEVPSRPGGKGIVHRSPAIQQLGGKRLLLRLDF
ncbi:DUF1826 domain-containing protein [Chryseolinea soli]|nr:DUF1826 domain-containing protein [Chryseolinea soli]